MKQLWYEKPASIWEEALPIGNGRMGAMVFGGVQAEKLQLNEESIWYGGEMKRDNPDTLTYLPEIRKLLLDGEIKKAERLMMLAMSGNPESAHPYQTLGDLDITFEYSMLKAGESVSDYIKGYKRTLDLENAVTYVDYDINDVHYSRKIFASHPADCIVIEMNTSVKGTLNFYARLSRSRHFNGIKKISNDTICMYGDLGKQGDDFEVLLKCKTVGGKIKLIGEHLVVENADQVTLYLGADSTFDGKNRKHLSWYGNEKDIEKRIMMALERASAADGNTVFGQHVKDYRQYFERVEFDIEGADKYDYIPTDKRILMVSGENGNLNDMPVSASSSCVQREEASGIICENERDAGLSPLMFDFGRYLLISCSREGGLPATLQGLWNKDLLPPWDCKYTININTEMNYWPAEICNLSECHMPLFELLKVMLPNGQQTAKNMYGCRGFVAHHNTTPFGETAVQDLWIPGSYWVMGAAWLCTHQWTHYLYTQDKEFLREQFPIMREAAQFFLDFMIEVDGYLMTCPSVSPENSYILPSGEKGANGAGVTMDNQIIRDLFDQCIKAADVLGVNDELNHEIKQARERLLPTRIGEDGRILEWREDYQEAEPGHRHVSHLYGLHPSAQITIDGTPELAAAARKTLEGRLSHGGGHTGWSRAWIINHYAKLWDGEAAYDNICKLFENSTYPNMFDKHPPFQIDGNFGMASGVAQMLLQSNEERIVILPALPSAWKTGHIKGIRTVGNGTADIFWEDGQLTQFVLTAHSAIATKIRYREKTVDVRLNAGEKFVW